MNDSVRVELPGDLADELSGKGFEEFFVFRGVLADAGTVVTLASAGIAVSANVATIVVSRDELVKFADAVRDWVRRKATRKADGVVAIDLSARRGDRETRVRLKVESKDGSPELDVVALSAFITSLFTRQGS
jgi:hypothetical protein